MRSLIVNADDFGLTPGVNRAILELHRRGAITSATLMARAAATEEAIEMARATPTLGVGCHVVLVDGEPMLSGTHDIPNLADPDSVRFQPTLGRFLGAIYRATPRIRIEYQIEREAHAQISFLLSRGVQLTHVDTHKHAHMLPRVLRPLLRAAKAYGITAVRNPFEWAWSVRATPCAPWLRRAQVRSLRLLHSAFRRIVAEEGFSTTLGAIGVLATGTLDGNTILSLLDHAPDGAWELVTHPGYNDSALRNIRTRLRESREEEIGALEKLCERPDFDLISFRDLPSLAPPDTLAGSD